ncbi:MAG: RNA polymerase sigma factor [Anaerolineales bacterium]|nr:RNA polymerase sigma factor [Anaerolineales bacterium]
MSEPSAQPTTSQVQAAFERLFADYQTPILNYLYRLLGSAELAEDLTQEAFARAWKARRTLPAVQNPRAWLYRIATNLARDHIRRQRLIAWLPFFQNEDREPALMTEPPERDPLDAERMRRALLKLPEDYGVPLVLYTCQELSVAEVAAALEISTDAVKQRLVRARQKLREEFSGKEPEIRNQK